MSIIPVLDLMIGQVVLAQGGNRDTYRPVHSRLTHSSQPLDVAQAIFNQTGCDWLYLADIDSFAGAPPNWPVYESLLDRGFGLWVDADWISDDRFDSIESRLGSDPRLQPIISTETLQHADQLSVLEALVQQKLRPIFSLDRKGQTLIARSSALDGCSPLELVIAAYGLGVRDLIVLDLQEVGTGHGFVEANPVAVLIEELRSELKDLKLTSGGGIRDAGDVRRWLDAGCDHVLVGTAIHNCNLTPDDVSQLGSGP